MILFFFFFFNKYLGFQSQRKFKERISYIRLLISYVLFILSFGKCTYWFKEDDKPGQPYPAMSFGYGVGDIMAISGLALKVCTAYKDAPGDYRNISDEVESLHIIINKAAQHFEGPALSDNSRQEGQKVLKGCQNVLEDLDALIEKYNSLGPTSPGTGQVLQRLKLSARLVLGTEDIATLRARLTSNTTLLNGFIQRFLAF